MHLVTRTGHPKEHDDESIMSPTPRVFVSACSSDLASARTIVNAALTQLECLPIEESVFGTEYGRIHEMQERLIDPCHAVIHLVGRDYGGEPDPSEVPNGQPRRSWTQLEYDYAVVQNKKLYVIVCDESFSYDEAEPQPDGERDLQQAHRDAVLKGEFLRPCIGCAWLRHFASIASRRCVIILMIRYDVSLRSQDGPMFALACGSGDSFHTTDQRTDTH